MRKILMAIVVMALSMSAHAGYYIAGEYNGWDAGANEMTDNGDGTYSYTVTGLDAGQRQEFKITDGTWDWNFPGPNSWYYTDANGEVTITFNTNEVNDGWSTNINRIQLSTDPGTWTIAGSFQGWDNANAATAMTSIGGGIYSLSQTLDAGTYYFKAVVTGTWDSISWDNRSVGTDNITLDLTETQDVIFYVDAFSGTIKTEVVPEPATMALLGFGAFAIHRRRKA